MVALHAHDRQPVRQAAISFELAVSIGVKEIDAYIINFYSKRLSQNELKSIADALNDHFGTNDWKVIQAGKRDEVWDSYFQRVFCSAEYKGGDYWNQETTVIYAFRSFYGVNSLEQHLQNNQDVQKDNQIIQNQLNNVNSANNPSNLGLLGLLGLIGLVFGIPSKRRHL